MIVDECVLTSYCEVFLFSVHTWKVEALIGASNL